MKININLEDENSKEFAFNCLRDFLNDGTIKKCAYSNHKYDCFIKKNKSGSISLFVSNKKV
jgi:hypothetical protein